MSWRAWLGRSARFPESSFPTRLPTKPAWHVTKPFVRPDARARRRGDRYQLYGEIARGGMGAVLKGRDPDLGRDVAIKVLRADHRDKADLVRRFVEEAQIGGQLQHPGIVPIYELGTFADRRPFFSMKLVKGPDAGRPARGPLRAGRRPAPVPVDLRGHLRRRWPTPTPAG